MADIIDVTPPHAPALTPHHADISTQLQKPTLPAMQVPFHRHHLGEAEKRSVQAALDGAFLTTGGLTAEFERRFAEYLRVRHVVGASSWTDAARLVLLAWGIGSGDEVITTPLTFIATANAILHAGATPVFVDVDPRTSNIDPNQVERAITQRTRAIIPVHLYGVMCDMPALRTIADRHGLKILEDAAHCVEGQICGRTGGDESRLVRVGTLGDAACFSFYATKNLTCGEGGAAATNDAALAEKLSILRLHGMDKSAAARHTGMYRHWDMTELGWKANLSNIDAAILLPQLPGIETRLAQREAIARRYEAFVATIPELGMQHIPPETRAARHLFTVLAPRGMRDEYLARLQQEGIGVAVNYRIITELSWYREHRDRWRAHGPLTNAQLVGERTLTLPLYPGLSSREVELVIGALGRAVKPERRA